MKEKSLKERLLIEIEGDIVEMMPSKVINEKTSLTLFIVRTKFGDIAIEAWAEMETEVRAIPGGSRVRAIISINSQQNKRDPNLWFTKILLVEVEQTKTHDNNDHQPRGKA